uniref:RING-H2 finger protein ATL5H n=1 Tax=Cajanus cajan TaxID=3821 RepID=A0A151SI39_CAJCA|nr:RING-H2 finger protein ATL5H [Cajanus cajan]
MRVLPPVACFLKDKTPHQSLCDCPICMEEFQNKELVQPFGVCDHQFHSSCINSWLLTGKITCPVCREQLFSL